MARRRYITASAERTMPRQPVRDTRSPLTQVEPRLLDDYDATMSDTDSLLKFARKYAVLFAERNLISGEEYVNSMLYMLSASDQPCRETVVRLWETVPQRLQESFIQMIRRATERDFRWHPFHIGGNPPPQTGEVLRRSADLNTARLQAWALEFVRFWDAEQAS